MKVSAVSIKKWMTWKRFWNKVKDCRRFRFTLIRIYFANAHEYIFIDLRPTIIKSLKIVFITSWKQSGRFFICGGFGRWNIFQIFFYHIRTPKINCMMILVHYLGLTLDPFCSYFWRISPGSSYFPSRNYDFYALSIYSDVGLGFAVILGKRKRETSVEVGGQNMHAGETLRTMCRRVLFVVNDQPSRRPFLVTFLTF